MALESRLPPPRPMRTRPTKKTGKLGDRAATHAPAARNREAAKETMRLVKTALKRPARGVAQEEAIMKHDEIQEVCSKASKSAAMDGPMVVL